MEDGDDADGDICIFSIIAYAVRDHVYLIFQCVHV